MLKNILITGSRLLEWEPRTEPADLDTAFPSSNPVLGAIKKKMKK